MARVRIELVVVAGGAPGGINTGGDGSRGTLSTGALGVCGAVQLNVLHIGAVSSAGEGDILPVGPHKVMDACGHVKFHNFPLEDMGQEGHHKDIVNVKEEAKEEEER